VVALPAENLGDPLQLFFPKPPAIAPSRDTPVLNVYNSHHLASRVALIPHSAILHTRPHGAEKFNALVAQCSYNNCKEVFAISGRYHTEIAVDNNGQEFSLAVCNHVAITPSIHPIRFPPQFPDAVKDQYVSAFSIMWHDANAALNRVRTALELLMDHFRVSRKRISQKKGVRKRVRLDLHIRIERLGEKRKSVADLVPALLAVKYLGNDGTHDTSATLDDLFDALDLSEGLLTRLFDPRHTTTEQIATEVLKRKGRRKPIKS